MNGCAALDAFTPVLALHLSEGSVAFRISTGGHGKEVKKYEGLYNNPRSNRG
jgi:hypothetical protein